MTTVLWLHWTSLMNCRPHSMRTNLVPSDKTMLQRSWTHWRAIGRSFSNPPSNNCSRKSKEKWLKSESLENDAGSNIRWNICFRHILYTSAATTFIHSFSTSDTCRSCSSCVNTFSPCCTNFFKIISTILTTCKLIWLFDFGSPSLRFPNVLTSSLGFSEATNKCTSSLWCTA